MIPKARTSLYKGRIYVTTVNGNTYLWNLPTATWMDPVDDNIQTKLANRGYKILATTTDKEKHYFFTDFYQRVLLSASDIAAGDFNSAATTNTFTITTSGAATLYGWTNGTAFTVTLTQAAIDAGKALDIDALVIELNNMLAKSNGSAGSFRADTFFEFFRFDTLKVGIKTKQRYTSVTGTDYVITLANGSGTFLAAGSGIRIAAAATVAASCKMATDLTAAIAAMASDMTLQEEKRELNGSLSYQKITIKAANISEVFADINKVDEAFIVNY